MASDPLILLTFVTLLLLYTKPSSSQTDCSGVVCQPTVNCIEEVLEEGSCCATCVQLGCTCEGYQYYDCVNVGFKDGKVPEGESYFVDFGSTECSCAPGGGRISCQFMPCSELPPNCIDIIQPADGCVQCGRIGCVHGDEKYEAGHTFHMSQCKFCHCPDIGGDLMCYGLPHCDTDADSTTQFMDTTETDPERQYDYPYSHEQDLLESTNNDVIEKNNNYKRNALQDHSMLDYDDDDLITLPTNAPKTIQLPEPTTTRYKTPLTSQQPRLNLPTPNPYTTVSISTVAPTTSKDSSVDDPLETTTQPTQEDLDEKKSPITATTQMPTDPTSASFVGKTTTTTLMPTDPTSASFVGKTTTTTLMPTDPTSASFVGKTTTTTLMPTDPTSASFVGKTTTTTLMPTDPTSASFVGKSTERDKTLTLKPQINNTLSTVLPESEAYFPKENSKGNILSTEETTTTSSSYFTTSTSGEPQVLFPLLLEEDPIPMNALNQSRSYDGSSKELLETCCAMGQQWSIDHGECENMPLSESDDCRLVEKQCCVSYIRENTCIAGMIAAKEGGVCLHTENENCERSHFKLCCDCCSLGLKIRKEGDSCESNLNLGYPCNHMIILCCGGEEQLIPPPDIKIVPKAEPTPEPDKDVDECTLNTHTCVQGERCVNTPESFVCIPEVRCEVGFLLEDGVCQDINECASSPAPCKPGFHCLNTLGSYVCQRKHLSCNRGYKSDENGTVCIDIDECRLGSHNCSNEQACHNLPGSYRCDCKAGYRFDTFRRKCLDINECWLYPGRLCHHTCDNTVGSYQCSCFAGFRLGQDGKRCEDVNECEQSPCNQECSNMYGSYQCYCKAGYKLADDGTTCQDIDECVQSIGSLCVFACVNTPGSYQCVCPEHGYTMSANGLTCKDVDECELGTHNCSSSEECYNIQGSYKCLSFVCPENYRRVSTMKCERISCYNYQDCQNTPVRISYHHLNFPTGVVVPAQIFRIAPSPVYAGDNIIMDIKKGNEENYFSARKFNPYTGILYLQRPVRKPKDFLLDVEMRLFRQGSVTSFLSRIYIFITAPIS